MMLRSLLDDIIRRRLWPIPALALIVALAAPLLFLRSAPESAPPVTAAAPAAAPAGQLPERAQRLLATSDPGSRAKSKARTGQDPFEPPSSHKAKATKSTSPTSAKKTDSGAAAGTAGKPVPVVITNADGRTADAAPSDSVTPPPADPTTTPTLSSPAVDVRFAEKLPTRVRRAIPRLQTFVADGTILAIFVKYSPNRDKAVFAIAPSTLVSGDVECRRKEGVCRYVDIPVGKHARLTVLSDDGSLVTRRLEVVNIDRKRSGASAQAAAASTGMSQTERRCLVKKLLGLDVDDRRLGLDACDA